MGQYLIGRFGFAGCCGPTHAVHGSDLRAILPYLENWLHARRHQA